MTFEIPLPRWSAATTQRFLDLADPGATASLRAVAEGGLASFRTSTMSTLLAVAEQRSRSFGLVAVGHDAWLIAAIVGRVQDPVVNIAVADTAEERRACNAMMKSNGMLGSITVVDSIDHALDLVADEATLAARPNSWIVDLGNGGGRTPDELHRLVDEMSHRSATFVGDADLGPANRMPSGPAADDYAIYQLGRFPSLADGDTGAASIGGPFLATTSLIDAELLDGQLRWAAALGACSPDRGSRLTLFGNSRSLLRHRTRSRAAVVAALSRDWRLFRRRAWRRGRQFQPALRK